MKLTQNYTLYLHNHSTIWEITTTCIKIEIFLKQIKDRGFYKHMLEDGTEYIIPYHSISYIVTGTHE